MARDQETLELLLEVGRLLSSKLDLPELLRSVMELASRVVGAESASLLLLDEKTQELYFDVALGLGEEAAKVRLKLGQGIAGTVAKTLAPEIINDARKDPRWSPRMDAASGFTTRSILAVPLRIKGHLLGVVEAINKKDGGFTEEDLRSFEAFASQAAVAIENARLFASLREERFKLRTVFSEMTDGAILSDPEGYILLANLSARKLLAVGDTPSTLEEALKTLIVKPPLREIFAGGQRSVPFTAERETPTSLLLSGQATRIEVGWLVVFRDETEVWKKERLKRTFLSLISHKLKTPLASVTGYAEILLEEFRDHPPQNDILLRSAESIAAQGGKLADLVDKLLRYTTLESSENTLNLKPFPLADLIEETVHGMKDWLAGHGATVSHTRGEPLLIVGDRLQLSEAVKNLIENAVKFDDKPQRHVMVRVERLGQEALLKVQDTGRGIPPEEQDRVFTRFHQIETYFTGQVDGWGLGLSYVKKIVEGHGGAVELESKLGEGTTVTLRLPLPGAPGKTR